MSQHDGGPFGPQSDPGGYYSRRQQPYTVAELWPDQTDQEQLDEHPFPPENLANVFEQFRLEDPARRAHWNPDGLDPQQWQEWDAWRDARRWRMIRDGSIWTDSL